MTSFILSVSLNVDRLMEYRCKPDASLCPVTALQFAVWQHEYGYFTKDSSFVNLFHYSIR